MTSRKEFLKQVGAVACMGLVPGLLNSCSPVLYVNGQDEGNTYRIRKSDFEGKPMVVVKPRSAEAPVCISREGEGFSAVSMLCTHKGCELSPAGQLLVCPCHGSEFTRQGAVLQPPANENLRQYRISTDNDFVTIHLQ
jgi:cytochrome b6-f complex iron-sulfur subunit